MLPKRILQKFIVSTLMIILAHNVQGQTTAPTWWFGFSGAANWNIYDGTTQRLNQSLIVPTAFHKGMGIRPYASVLMEYRPGRIWGGMLNLAYDGRGAKFRNVIAPCNCPATLKTNISYFSIEPSLRLGSATSDFYFFAGPRIGINMKKDFSYTQLKQPNTDAEISEMRKVLISAQIGVGYDYDISSPNSTTKVSISPFLSYHPYFGQDPRKIESWSVSTLRAGIAFKFGKGAKAIIKETAFVPPAVVVPVRDVNFSVREPMSIPVSRLVSETLPLRNSVFFDEGSNVVPSRYVMLTPTQASAFKEDVLQKEQSASMEGRSARQLNVYHNIMNILGDRLRSNPGSSITLTGASLNGPQEGKVMAEAVKQYITTVFGIDGSRINTVGRTKPVIPSEQPGGTKELVLLREGDRRVDVESTSPTLLYEVGGGMMRPVQIYATQVDPLDSHVILNNDGASTLLKSWSADVTDANGMTRRYGPYYRDQESIAGQAILNGSNEGYYKISMVGETIAGLPVKKEASVHLIRQNETVEKAYRYSILFDFDKANTIASYEKFLTDIVSPLITDGSTVVIHGHTDIIGEEDYNYKLSQNRAQEAQKIIARALTNAGKNNVKFETLGFGEDTGRSPFENNLVEERFYNRTVIIDIIPVK